SKRRPWRAANRRKPRSASRSRGHFSRAGRAPRTGSSRWRPREPPRTLEPIGALSWHSNLDLVLEQLGDRVAPQGLGDLLQGRSDRIRLGADQGYPQDGDLALVLSVYLRHRGVKAVS